jgi:hypothetical protein
MAPKILPRSVIYDITLDFSYPKLRLPCAFRLGKSTYRLVLIILLATNQWQDYILISTDDIGFMETRVDKCPKEMININPFMSRRTSVKTVVEMS